MANNYFDILRDENDEPTYTYTDENMRYFFRKRIKGGKYSALSQYSKRIVSDDVLNNISKGLGVNGNVREIRDNYFEYTNKHKKAFENEFDSQIED